MRYKRSVVAAGAILALSGLLSGCGTLIGSSSQSLIVGKWEVENAPAKMTAEFHQDGTAQINIMGQASRGTWTMNDNQLTWMMNGMSTTGKVNVSANELEITDVQGRTIRYQRK